ncbi:T9SS type A sorting domain-containing protein, partial [Crocinitomicaceae bacterium]|nr:T9SS type A sorting domain-containing protein [Crocinitomicaceae bacterium]
FVHDALFEGFSELRVIDLNGRVVLSKPLEVKSGMNLFVINESFQSGVYYLKIVNGQAYSNVVRHIIR